MPSTDQPRCLSTMTPRRFFRPTAAMRPVILAAAFIAGCQSNGENKMSLFGEKPQEKPRAAFDVGRGNESWGTIVFELEPLAAPATVGNFLRYVNDGYYDGTIIHRVLVGADARINIFQGGGYTQVSQTSGPAKPGQYPPIPLETKTSLPNSKGTISMARDAAPDTATSEYFVNVEDNHRLNFDSPDKPGYAAFGRIVSGWDVVEKITKVEVTTNPDPVLKGEKSLVVEPAPVIRKARKL